MLVFFRRNLFVNILWLLLFTIILFFFYIVFPSKAQMVDFHWPFENYIDIGLEFLNNRYSQLIFSITLIFLQGYLVSRFIIKHKISRNLSLVPGAVMVLYSCFVMQPYLAHEIILANLFFVFSVGSLFKLYKKYRPIGTLFNSGFYLAIAVFIYSPYSIYLPILLLGLLALRGINPKEILQLLSGFIAPFFLGSVLLYYNDNLGNYFSDFEFVFQLPEVDFSRIDELIKPLVAVAIALTIVFFQNMLRKKKNFDAIKKVELNFWMLLLGFFSLFFVASLTPFHMMILSVPIGICGGLILESQNNKITKEFVFLSFIGFYFLLVFEVI